MLVGEPGWRVERHSLCYSFNFLVQLKFFQIEEMSIFTFITKVTTLYCRVFRNMKKHEEYKHIIQLPKALVLKILNCSSQVEIDDPLCPSDAHIEYVRLK